MKNYLVIFSLFIALQCSGQVNSTVVKIDKNTVIKDETGRQLTYEEWQKIIAVGDHSLRPIERGSSIFLLYKMSPEEKEKNIARKKSKLSNSPRPSMSEAFPEGEKFVGEKFTTLTGEKLDPKPSDGKIYVINFWFIDCPPCKREIPELNQLVEKYKEENVVFIGIALDSKSELKDFLKSTPFNYQIVANGRAFSSKYGIKGFPTNVVVGKDGLIKFSTTGFGQSTVFWIDKSIKEQLVIN